MAALSIKRQLNDFVEFASRRIETGSEVSSLEELFQRTGVPPTIDSLLQLEEQHPIKPSEMGGMICD